MVDLVAGQQHFLVELVPVGVPGEGVLGQLAVGVGQEQAGGGQGGVDAALRVLLVIDVDVHQGVFGYLPVDRGRDHVALLLGGFGLAVPAAGQADQAVGQIRVAQLAAAFHRGLLQIPGATGDLDPVEAVGGRLLADQVDHATRRHGAIQGGGGAPEDLDLFHGQQVDLRLQVPVVVQQLQAIVEVLVIDEAADAEQVQAANRAAAQFGVHPRGVAQGRGHRVGIAHFQGLAVQHRDTLGRILGIQRGLGGGVAVGFAVHREFAQGDRVVAVGVGHLADGGAHSQSEH